MINPSFGLVPSHRVTKVVSRPWNPRIAETVPKVEREHGGRRASAGKIMEVRVELVCATRGEHPAKLASRGARRLPEERQRLAKQSWSGQQGGVVRSERTRWAAAPAQE